MANYSIISSFYRELVKPRGHFANQVKLLALLFRRYGVRKDSRIIDIAAGTGDVILELRKTGYSNLSAVDGSSEMLARWKAKGKRILSVEQRDWKRLGRYFQDSDPFDFIFAFGHSLPHLDRGGIKKVMKEARKALRPGGVFAFDMRPWSMSSGRPLRESDRLQGVHRYLLNLNLKGVDYMVDDSVSYSGSKQIVHYRLTPMAVGGKRISTELKYSIFGIQEAHRWMLGAGFGSREFDVLQFGRDLWPYLVVIGQRD